MDGGAWWATVHGVAKSGTQLSDFTHALKNKNKPEIICYSSQHGDIWTPVSSISTTSLLHAQYFQLLFIWNYFRTLSQVWLPPSENMLKLFKDRHQHLTTLFWPPEDSISHLSLSRLQFSINWFMTFKYFISQRREFQLNHMANFLNYTLLYFCTSIKITRGIFEVQYFFNNYL